MEYLKQDAVVILVHGTWGKINPLKKMLWFEEGSQFRDIVARIFEGVGHRPSFHAFLWSGRNTFTAREKAAHELLSCIMNLVQSNRNAKFCVIAHSHGGNVALRALGMLAPGHDVHLITLATPFIRVFPKPSQVPDKLAFLIFVATLFAGSMIIDQRQALIGAFHLSQQQAYWGNWCEIAFYTVFFCSFLYGILDPTSRGRMSRNGQRIVEQSSFGAGPRLLAIRGVNDEASLALSLGAISSTFSRWYTYWLPIAVALTGFAFIIAVFYNLFFERIPINAVLSKKEDWYFVLFLFSMVWDLMYCFNMLTYLAFGTDVVASCNEIELDVSNAPDCSGVVTVNTLPPSLHGMRHGLYTHPAVGQSMENWLVQHFPTARTKVG